MNGVGLSPLLALHLSDGMLTPGAEWAGLLAAGLLAFVGAWRVRDEEVPRVALLTAAFFVASLVHVPVPGGPKTHLLLNGLLGVVLGRRALLAVPVGLAMQAALFGHGGYLTLGVNSCVMGLPALLAAGLFGGLRRVPWAPHPRFRAGLVTLTVLTFVLGLVYALALLLSNRPSQLADADLSWANAVTFHPATLLGALALGALAAWAEHRLGHAPEFALGLLVGATAVLATALLNGLLLVLGGRADWHALALLTFVIHLPLAVVEGIILGFTVGFLARVKPEMLGVKAPKEALCAVELSP